jgi:pectin methylesterase-like acyl-CoA thioesterase
MRFEVACSAALLVACTASKPAGPGPEQPSLTASVQELFPEPGATGVCADAVLALSFAAPVSVGNAGAIRVYRASDPSAPVDTIDVGAPSYVDTIGGRQFHTVRPVVVRDGRVSVHLHSAVLEPGSAYYVEIDPGVLVDAAGKALPGIAGGAAWSFETGTTAPADPTLLRVAGDGSGDFCSVQGAVDYVPASNTRPTVISIKAGVYDEIVMIAGKHALTLRGDDRKSTVITYPNNDTLQQGRGTKFRALVEVENVNGLVIENLTLHNTTPQGGSQAEALRVEPGDQVILRNADFKSLQDTLLLSGRVYVHDCYIEGNVDYIWGKGTAFFERCELKTVGRGGYQVQSRNSTNYGYVFVDSTFSADPGVTGHLLGRIEIDRFPNSHIAYVDCTMGPHIAPQGFSIENLTAPEAAANLRFWEYRSRDTSGALIDVSQRIQQSKQLTEAEAATMRDKSVVFGGWNPTE